MYGIFPIKISNRCGRSEREAQHSGSSLSRKMAAISRLQLLHHSSLVLKPFLLFPKCPPLSPSYSFNPNLRRKFSFTPLCSTSDSTHEVPSLSLHIYVSLYVCACGSIFLSKRQKLIFLGHSQSSSSTVGSRESIVGDLLDYLNESWTQFHAAGTKRSVFLLVYVPRFCFRISL